MGVMRYTPYLLLLITHSIVTAAQPIVRQNIGLIYEQLPGQIITGHDLHEVILAIPYNIPSAPRPKPLIYNTIRTLQLTSLGPRDSHDAKMLQQASDLDKLLQNVDINIIKTLKNIAHFLSDPINNRPKRAILGFLGELFKSVFGLATTRDMDSIINVIHHLDAKIGTLADVNVKTAQGLHDVAQQHQHFLDTYIKQQDIVQESLLNITQSIDSWSDDFSTTLTSIQADQDRRTTQTAILSAQMIVLTTRIAYQQGLSNVENSLRLLSTGILAPDMIQPTELALKLATLDTQLKLKNPGSEVTIIDTAYYYSQPVALYTYSKTHLYIHINVIISATDAAFNLYQVITTHVPINTENTTSSGSTLLHTDKTFLAVNEAETLYLEMTNADLLTCQGSILKVCARTMPRIRSDQPTCLMAAFNGNQADIAKLCTFQVHPLRPIQTRAIAIGKDRYLVTTNREYYHVICQHMTPTTKKASAYAVIGVPCMCHLQFDSLYLPNTKIPCNDTSSTHFIMHAANTPILLAFTNNLNITSSSLHHDPIHIPHLHTQAIIKSMTNISKLSSDITMDLEPFTRNILIEAKNAADILDRPIQDTPIRENIASFFGSPVWNYIVPVTCILNAVGFFYLLYVSKGRALFAAVPTVSARPHNISWKFINPIPQSKNTETPAVNLDQYVDAHNIFTLIFVALIIYAVIKTICKCKTRIARHFGVTHSGHKTNPTITLKIYQGHVNHTIPLLSLPYERDSIINEFIPTLTAISALSCPYPRINMTWNGPISFNINGKQKSYYLPNHIILPLAARFSIIPALKDDTTTTGLTLKTNEMTTSLHATETQDGIDTDPQSDNTTSLIKNAKDMTTTELLTAIVSKKSETGNET